MLVDNIFTLEFSNNGKFKVNLSAFLPASKSDLKKVFQMIDRAADPMQNAEELSAHIISRLNALPDSNYFKKDRQKLIVDLSYIADYYGLQNIPDLTEDKPKLKKAEVFSYIGNVDGSGRAGVGMEQYRQQPDCAL